MNIIPNHQSGDVFIVVMNKTTIKWHDQIAKKKGKIISHQGHTCQIDTNKRNERLVRHVTSRVGRTSEAFAITIHKSRYMIFQIRLYTSNNENTNTTDITHRTPINAPTISHNSLIGHRPPKQTKKNTNIQISNPISKLQDPLNTPLQRTLRTHPTHLSRSPN